MSVYNPPTLTGFNSSPPPDDGTQVAANQILWATILSKIGTPLKIFTEDMNSAIAAAIDTLDSLSRDQNILINGDFAVAQRGTTFTSATTPANNDDTYLLDRWTLLSDGNDIVDVSQSTTVIPTGGTASILLDVETANAKFGIIQFVENRIARSIIGGICSLSFQARITGSSITAIRAGVLAWSSTADSVTSDVVSAWGAAGTNPTLVANWTFENTPAALTAPTTSFQTYTIENISIDTSSAANVAVFIWIDDVTTTIGDFLYISDVQLEIGATATSFKRRQFTTEEELCKRYCQRPGAGAASKVLGAGYCYSTTQAEIFIPLSPSMRTESPTATYSSASAFLLRDSNAASVATTAISSTIIGSGGILVGVTTAAGLTDAQGTVLISNTGTITVSNEL